FALAPASDQVHATTVTANESGSSGIVLVAPTLAPTSTTATQQLVQSLDQLVARSPMTLTSSIEPLVAGSGASVGVSLIELGSSTPLVWSYNGHQVFTAASTYKLVALMMEAEGIAAGTVDPNGLVCYEDDDYEDGWFTDYEDGACFTRNELASRAGQESDNTAGHMLVRDVGGADAVNAWAASLGASDSDFFNGNSTSAIDLSILLAAEARGALGGAAAQEWLYPFLTGTHTEAGVPAGVNGQSVVVHKTGTLELIDNDAALVASGPNGAYVLVVMTDNMGGDAGWQLIASISSAVWNFEAARAH
ncbi:MAG TPA: serine hydrolase, partial [Candidatus Dormibacteraeota bacterium]|nr:serine hydrolase [Candidatus Dormibacteraeota bacterium]